MTRYCVQISRWYEVDADDEEDAALRAGEVDDTEDTRTESIVNVTDLTALGALQPGEKHG